MQIQINIDPGIIANLMVSFIESRDQVTSGWCGGIAPKGAKPEGHEWYSEPKVYQNGFAFIVEEVEDDLSMSGKQHVLDAEAMARGLSMMADKYPHKFAEVLADDADSWTADLFVQCALFGEERYA